MVGVQRKYKELYAEAAKHKLDITELKKAEAGEKLERVYDPKDCTILPRMWADRADYIQAYRSWENMPGEKKATFGKNIDLFIN